MGLCGGCAVGGAYSSQKACDELGFMMSWLRGSAREPFLAGDCSIDLWITLQL